MIADAVPKKRGPKTEVLEALLKRVNGLEERLKDETKAESESASRDDASNLSRNQAKDVVPSTETQSYETGRGNNRDDVPNVLPVADRIQLYEIPITYQLGSIADLAKDSRDHRIHGRTSRHILRSVAQ